VDAEMVQEGCSASRLMYGESARGRIGFDWSMVMPAASRGWGRSSSLNSQPKNKEQQHVGSRCLIKGRALPP
jgi:hypothetical protein